LCPHRHGETEAHRKQQRDAQHSLFHLVPFALPARAQAQGKLACSSGGSLLCRLRGDLLHKGSGKTAPAHERPALLRAFGTIGFTS
jgi:hypothetical protein